jgi:hypothetical protein
MGVIGFLGLASGAQCVFGQAEQEKTAAACPAPGPADL